MSRFVFAATLLFALGPAAPGPQGANSSESAVLAALDPQVLARALRQHDPKLRFDGRKLERLGECVDDVRQSLHALRSLPRSAETLQQREASVRRLHAALETFRKTTGMTGTDLVRMIDAAGGIDNGRPETSEVKLLRLEAPVKPGSER